MKHIARKAVMLEAICTKCGETFVPEDEDDLIHGVCEGTGYITGEWVLDKAPVADLRDDATLNDVYGKKVAK
jgi:hypothetical protein